MPGEDPWEAQRSCGANTPLRSAAAGGSGTSGQQARREAAQVGPGWPPPPTEAAPPRLGLPGRAAERLFPSGPAPATGSGSVRPRSDGRSGGDMESGGSFGAPLRCRLLFLAACWAVAATAAGERGRAGGRRAESRVRCRWGAVPIRGLREDGPTDGWRLGAGWHGPLRVPTSNAFVSWLHRPKCVSFSGISTRTALRLLQERGKEMLGVLHLFPCRAASDTIGRYPLSSAVPGAVAALTNPSRSGAGIAADPRKQRAVCAALRAAAVSRAAPVGIPASFAVGRASRKAVRVRDGLLRSGGC